ncbi:sigma-54 dependent transcriptional regulator [Polyangium sp. y55x31]|uniref:sigma-54-dependent transcriptional regulator n=1 Tax=Polyangium sp. y55x31 TaxID=3042688 RepID=UPI00248230D7|nr:sigma-54 dependent transcriptional regulator [Polyangium sp. y55x31]MDI1480000.1 sigma-54 dependent transcriptional regulator [Polyangium sp. y55x31]
MPRILLVEDESIIRSELRRLLAREGHDVAEAQSVREAEEEHDLASFDLVITDVRLPGAPGTDLIGSSAAHGVPVLVMTSYATVRSAVDVMKRGAVDYLSKPFEHDELLALVERILSRPRTAAEAPAAPAARVDGGAFEGLIGRSAAMREVEARLRKVAPTDATVLVLGESGTGKELVAAAIHRMSRRSGRAFVPVNCAAIPEGLIESELFGHERGAFTGATSAHAGLVEAADGGTLFLDEIGELPQSAQARLLRFLQTGEVRHVGSTRARKVSVRLVAATHRDLAAMVQAGTFRSDLYFRLRVIEVRLPPLRERGDDALALASHFITEGSRKAGRPVPALSPDAEKAIMTHSWPGNVRELENAIERALILSDGGTITAELLGLEAEEESRGAAQAQLPSDVSLEEYFRRFVLENQDTMTETELAKRLGISRKTLWERRQRMGLSRSK